MAVSVWQFIGGLLMLLVGGRLLVSASVDAARRLGVSPLVVGLTLVAWGTSAPELALNLISAWKGRGDLALGNVVGANICNMSLVLGVAALILPLVIHERLIRVEIWLNAGILVFMSVIGLVAGFERWNAGLMLVVFAAYSAWTLLGAMRESAAHTRSQMAETAEPDPTMPGPPMSWTMIGVCFAGGLALLSVGGTFASDGATGMATAMRIPTAIIGVTIVSFGTTLPELITSIIATLRGQTDLAVGNAIGSCLFNAGAIFGLAGLMAPPLADHAFVFPLSFMSLLALVLIPISRTHGRTVARVEGAALLGSYVAFLVISAMRLQGR